MENKPDHYEILFPGWPASWENLVISSFSNDVDGGEKWAATELEKRIRERGS